MNRAQAHKISYGFSRTADKSSYVFGRILSYIRDNHLVAGDKLPSETELAAKFAVSRVIIREGLSGLKFLGLIEAGTRGGTRIKTLDFDVLNSALGFHLSACDFSFDELLEARIVLELAVLEIVMKKASMKQLDTLDSLIDTALPSKGDASYFHANVEVDINFHVKLFDLANNNVLGSFARLLRIFFANLPFRADMFDSNFRPNVEHHQIVAALRAKNINLAKGVMLEHLNRYKTLEEKHNKKEVL
jgi:GntR family transcriptional repressor for pyruvate dehydrogenase complex